MVTTPLAILILGLATTAPTTATADRDLGTVRERFIESMVPADATIREELVRNAQRQSETLRADGSWPDIDYADQARSAWKTRAHLERTVLMARACHLTADPALRAKIQPALDYWLAKDFRNPNWWHNEIGTPLLIGTTAVLLGPDLSAQQKEKSLAILRRSDWAKWTGQNLVWGISCQILRGLVENDPQTIAAAYDRLWQEVRTDKPEGIQVDFSFHQHGAQLYSGGYGLDFAQDLPRLASFSRATRWQIPEEKMQILCGLLLDAEQWMMHNQRIDYSTVGREITRKGKTAVPRAQAALMAPSGATYGLPRAIAMMAEFPTVRQNEFREFGAHLAADPNAPPLVGNRHFWCSDYMVHHRPGWMTSIKMFSTRTINAELVNSEGTRSHHLSDGANFLYLTGDEYLDIFPVWDWTQIPGTTAEQNTLELAGESKSIGIKSKCSFVGGVSDGTFGLAAMQLARGKLSAQKVWVFLDNSYVCLGAGITCDSDNPVATTVNQCLLDGKVSKALGWIHHANVGYVFPDLSNQRAVIRFTSGMQEGAWADIGTGSKDLVHKDVFNLWLDHGRRPKDVSYVYVVFPNYTAGQTLARSKSLGLEILANTADGQAVRDEKLDLTAIAFWKAGKVGSVEVDQPCLLLVRRDKGKTLVSVSNPENRPLTVNVRIDGQQTIVKLPDGPMAGSSVTQELSGH